MKLFLPVIEQANRDLESQIRTDGIASVQIDAEICEGHGETSTAPTVTEHSDELVQRGDEDSPEELIGMETQEINQQVQLELVIGDIDDAIGDQIEGCEVSDA